MTRHAHLIKHGDAVVASVLASRRDGAQEEEDFRELRYPGADARKRIRCIVHNKGDRELVEELEVK